MTEEELELERNKIFYKKILTDNECQRLEEYYNNLEPQKNNYYVHNTKELKQKFLSDEEGLWLKEKLLGYVKELNDNFYQIPSLKFGKFGLLECDVNSDSEHQWHQDIGALFPYTLRRITLVIFILDRSEYDGGQLEFLPKLKNPIKMERGYMIAFESHKAHRISPIKKGIRRTIVNWIYEYTPELDKYVI
jgi:hypothetical protein